MDFFRKFSLIVAAAGVVGAAFGSAQTVKTQTVVSPLKWSANCPIAIRAEHGSDGGVVAVKGGSPHGVGQQLHLTLDNSGKSAISAVRIIVNGWNPKLRTFKTNSADTEASETVDLKLSIGSGKTADADVWVKGLTAADSIDLVGVSYADGSNWKPAVAEPCRVAPDLTMLISSR